MKMDLKWVENEDLRLKLRLNESPRCSESNGSPPAPPKPAINSEASNSGIPGKSAYPIFCLRYAGPISQTGHGHVDVVGTGGPVITSAASADGTIK